MTGRSRLTGGLGRDKAAHRRVCCAPMAAAPQSPRLDMTCHHAVMKRPYRKHALRHEISVIMHPTAHRPVPSAADHQAAWTRLVDAFPYADAVVPEAALYEYRHRLEVSAALVMGAVDWAKSSEEVTPANANNDLHLTPYGQDRWHARHFVNEGRSSHRNGRRVK